MKNAPSSDEEKKRQVMELTSLFLHKHYGENSTELLLAHLDDVFSWVGTAEHEYSADPDVVASTLRSFAGKVPHCNIADEHYDVIQPQPDIFICSGTLWVSTSPASETYLRVHQRISTVFRWSEKGPRCCHLHLSNPYNEMEEGDVGFPEKMSLESRRYFQEQIALQKKQIEEQHAFIIHMYVEDLSTGLHNRNKFNQVCESLHGRDCGRLGIAYFDLNGLKKTNDLHGHQAGDALIRNTAEHLLRHFGKNAYRIGGDEFIVIDAESDKDTFYGLVQATVQAMHDDDISVAHGISWRSEHGNIDEQINEADKNMYLAKREFYARSENNRRQR